MVTDTTQLAEFRTPHGNRVRFAVRPETSDWNTCNAITAVGDEYHMPSGLSGWALDVGAHIGACTVTLLVDNPDLRVVAIEALPENVALIRENLELNGVADRCIVIEGAAGDGSDTRIGYGADGTHDYIGNASAPKGNREVVAKGVSLQDAIHATTRLSWDGALDAVAHFVWAKLDCEGCEGPFLTSRWVAEIDHIEGEVHPECGGDRLKGILKSRFDVTFPGWAANPDFGPFTAVRR
jgi:FkbM family methyltransferase